MSKFRTLAQLCAALDCRTGDLLDYDLDPADLLAAEEDHGGDPDPRPLRR